MLDCSGSPADKEFFEGQIFLSTVGFIETLELYCFAGLFNGADLMEDSLAKCRQNSLD